MPASRVRLLSLIALLSLLPVMAWAAGPALLHYRSVTDGSNQYGVPRLAARGDSYWTASPKRSAAGAALPAEVSRVTVGGVQVFRTKLSVSVDDVVNLEADAADNVYLAGAFFFTSAADCVIKVDRGGRQLWVAPILAPDNGLASVRQIALDSQGNPFVAGSFIRANVSYAYLCRLRPDNGQLVWGFTMVNGIIPKLAIGGGDNPVIAFARQARVTVAKVSGAGGTLMWTHVLDESIGNPTSVSVTGLACDTSGSPIVNHHLRFPDGEYLWFLRKLSSGGVVQWTKGFSLFFALQDAVRLAPDGSVRVLGLMQEEGSGALTRCSLLAYTNSGGFLFHRSVVDHGSNHFGDSLAVAPSGQAIVLSRVNDRFFLDAFALPIGVNVWNFQQTTATSGDTFSLCILPTNIAVVGGLESITKSSSWAYDLH